MPTLGQKRVSKPSGRGYKYSKHAAQYRQPPQQGGGGGAAGGMDQELMQQIAAEGGVEALQEYIAKMGTPYSVPTLPSFARRDVFPSSYLLLAFL